MNTSRGTGEPLDDLQTTLAEVQQVPKVERIERRFERRTKVIGALALMIMLLYGAWLSYNSYRIAQSAAQTTINEQDIQDLREANRLREERGLPQIPLPAPGEPVDVKALAAAAAALALDDIQNDNRFKGPEGSTGATGPSGVPGTPGTTGEAGRDGSRGQDGRGISRVYIDEDGYLWVEFSDDYPSMMVGLVVGPKGDQGDPGPITTIRDIQLERTSNGGCLLVVNTTDGKRHEAPANPGVCPII